MKNYLLLLLLLIVATSCRREDPTGMTYAGTTTEPDKKWTTDYINKGSVTVYNTSSYSTYDVNIGGNTYRLKPQENSGVIMLAPSTYTLNAKQLNNRPWDGKYEGLYTEYNSKITIEKNSTQDFMLPRQYKLKIINTDKSHRYSIVMNNYRTFIIDKNSYCILTIDEGYYYITAEQLDVALWDTDRAASIFIHSGDMETTIRNWQEIEL